jgi:hypothetical protein
MSEFKTGINPQTVADGCRKLGIRSIFTGEIVKARCPRYVGDPCVESCDNFTDCFLKLSLTERAKMVAPIPAGEFC